VTDRQTGRQAGGRSVISEVFDVYRRRSELQ